MSMEEHQPKAEAGPGHGASVDPVQIVQELQDAGLYEFATDIDFQRVTENSGAYHLPRPSPVGYNNPPPQPTQPLDVQQCLMANQAAELAANRATQVLQLSRISLHKLTSTYNPRATGSGGTENSAKRRKTSRGADAGTSRSGSKGLRHFSMKVCEKVEAKFRTTYNEVADELVEEMGKIEAANKNGQYDEKNIRRRVYDAINVLMAMDIIQKEKKEITWKGFPKLGSSALDRLRTDRANKVKEVEQKQAYLQDMIEQQLALKKLLDRGSQRGPRPGGTQLFLPFILVQAKQDAEVEVKISEDLMDVQFEFGNSPFQIHDDSHVLKKMAEHLAQQQPQQPQPFPNSLASGLGLPWPGLPNGTGGNLLADAALAQLAAAVQAQAQGGVLAYGYPPHAAAAAALYQQQQQHLLQQQQQQQQQAQAQQGQGQRQGLQAGQGQGQVGGHAGGGQAAAAAAAAQPALGASAAAAGNGPAAAGALTQPQPHLQHPQQQQQQQQQQQLQTLHALQVQLQQQQQLHAQLQLQAQAQHPPHGGGVRGGLPPLALPPLGAPLGHPLAPTGAGATGQPPFGLAHSHPLPPPLLPLNGLGAPGPHPRLALPQLQQLQQGQPQLLPLPPQIPANLAAALNTAAQPPPLPQLPPAVQQAPAPAGPSGGGAAGAGAAEAGSESNGVGAATALGAMPPPPSHGLQMPQLVAAAPAAAFPLVA